MVCDNFWLLHYGCSYKYKKKKSRNTTLKTQSYSGWVVRCMWANVHSTNLDTTVSRVLFGNSVRNISLTSNIIWNLLQTWVSPYSKADAWGESKWPMANANIRSLIENITKNESVDMVLVTPTTPWGSVISSHRTIICRRSHNTYVGIENMVPPHVSGVRVCLAPK